MLIHFSGQGCSLFVELADSLNLPLLIAYIDWLPEISQEIWHLLILSSLFQAIYFFWGWVSLTNLAMFGTYSLVLASIAFADNVSLTVALRQTSVPVGGVFILGESFVTKRVGRRIYCCELDAGKSLTMC